MFKTPKFWDKPNYLSLALQPLSWGYNLASHLYRKSITPEKVSVPVICVGNLVMGGAGKTPTVIAIVKILQSLGHTPHILSRGYGVSIKGTLRVDLKNHTYLQVGDEPLLLARVAPTWVGSDRKKAAKAAIEHGASILIMDDGLQNPSLIKDFNFVVIDALQWFGNEMVFPAGPLREPLEQGLAKAQSIIIIGDSSSLKTNFIDQLNAQLICDGPVKPQPVVAFAGLGYPQKFHNTLILYGYEVKEFISFADHHPYTFTDIQHLKKIADTHKVSLITTSKDHLRLPREVQSQIMDFPVALKFDNLKKIEKLLTRFKL